MLFDRVLLGAFTNYALHENLTYHVNRRRALELFTRALDPNGDVDIPSQVFVQIRLYLMSRTEQLTNESKFAFENALVTLVAMGG